MKKGTGVFKKIEETILVCDECGVELTFKEGFINFDFRWSDGYDNYGDDLDFCSLACMIRHIKKDVEFPEQYFPGGEDVKLSMPSKIAKDLFNL